MERIEKQELIQPIKGGTDTESQEDEPSDDAFRSYDEVVNYFLETYDKYRTISATIDLKQREEYQEVIFAKTLRCGKVCGKSARIHRFLENLNENVHNNVQYYYAGHTGATFDTIECCFRMIRIRINAVQ